MKIPKPNVRAFTVLELMVVVVVLGVLTSIVLPALARAQARANRIRCTGYLKQMGIAFRIFHQDNGDYPMRFRTNNFDGPSFARDTQMFKYFQALSNELTSPVMLACPADKQRTVARDLTTDFNSSHVSYFVGLNADETIPTSLLAGDRNLTNGIAPNNGVLEITTNQVSDTNNWAVGWTTEIHQGVGNVLFADSHVEQLTSSKLRDALRTSGLATNRLVLP